MSRLVICLVLGGLVADQSRLALAEPQQGSKVSDGHETGAGDLWAEDFKAVARTVVNLVKNSGAFEGLRLDWVALDKIVSEADVKSVTKSLTLADVTNRDDLIYNLNERDNGSDVFAHPENYPKSGLNYPSLKRIEFNRVDWDHVLDLKVRAAFVLHEFLGLLRMHDAQCQLSSLVPGLLDVVPFKILTDQYNKPAPGKSKHYENLVTNTDGTVSIQKPWFQSPDGTAKWLSSDTPALTVCQLYGFDTYVSNSLRYDYVSGGGVVLKNRGEFSYFVDGTYYRITSIGCANTGHIALAPIFDSQTLNADGSVSTYMPRFSMNGQQLYLSDQTSSLTICRYLGFDTYVSNSPRYDYVSGGGVVLKNRGEFSSFADGTYYRISWITCAKNPYHFPSRDLDQLPIQNDDGSYTLMGPHFLMNGSHLAISTDTPALTVCELFGFSSYVSNSIRYDYVSGGGVVLKNQGEFSSFADGTYYKYRSLVCR